MTRLNEAQLIELKALVNSLRKILWDDFSELLEGRFGIRPDGTVEAVVTLRATDEEHRIRIELEQVLSHFATEGNRGRAGRDQLLRESVFTQVNRLLAVRIAEEIRLIPESLRRGRQSQGFRDLVNDVAPLLAADPLGGYWAYLGFCGDELAADAPSLFDPRNPLLALAPSANALDQVIESLMASSEGLWQADDTLGWAYQFFNSEDERSVMREGGAPATSRELAVRNQFFTPDYVVSFLVHNTLGRRLLESNPTSQLRDDLDWLVDPPTKQGSVVALESVKVLDPACGSGHFLLGAYEVLERAWLHGGVDPELAAPMIVPCLWGVDIDPRAAQVAAAAVMLRARRSCGTGPILPRPNTVCARVLPAIPEADRAVLTLAHRHTLDDLQAELSQAPVLGSLLQVERFLDVMRAPGMATAKAKNTEPLHLTAAAAESAASVHDDVIAVLQKTADEIGSSPIARLTAAEADDALRFVQAMTQRYDAVLMNPPFGEPVTGTKPYIKSAYPWIPTKDYNLFAAFVGRGIELCNDDGYVGAITSRAGMFLSTFKEWRQQVLLGHELVTLADLGFDVMKQAMVEAAAYVIGTRTEHDERPIPFLRVTRESPEQRGRVLHALVGMQRNSRADERLFSVAQANFDSVPGAPLAYWMTDELRGVFAKNPAIEGNAAQVRQGMASGDDFRFVRAFWEVDPYKIGSTRDETLHGKRWVPFAKGGEYSPFWSDIHLVVEFERDGERLRSFDGSVLRSPQLYFRPGLTWPARTQGGFNIRILPSGCAFGHKGPAVLPLGSTHPLDVLGVMLARPHIALLDSIATFGSYEVGAVGRLPWPKSTADQLSAGRSVIASICEFKVRDDTFDETSRRFVRPNLDLNAVRKLDEERLDAVLRLLRSWEEYEQLIMRVLGLSSDSERYLDTEVGAIELVSGAEVQEVDPTATKEARTPRWIDAELETTMREAKIPAEVAVAGLLADESRITQRTSEQANRALSYLVGCSFGRWDVRVGASSAAPDVAGLFEPVNVCSPGMLVDAEGRPIETPPHQYPCWFPADGILLDEPGHRLDIVAVMRAAETASGHPSLLDDIETALAGTRRREVRAILRQSFFKDHLGRYSKSRRKAPIYWPLYVPSRDWGVWVYAPKLNREVLFAIAAAGDQRLGTAIAGTRRLEAQLLEQGGRTTRELAQELERERKLTEELRRFTDEARRIAEIGWVPDLDDGIALCAAPLAELFPDWKTELVAVRKDIKNGLYDDWAHVSKYKAAL